MDPSPDVPASAGRADSAGDGTHLDGKGANAGSEVALASIRLDPPAEQAESEGGRLRGHSSSGPRRFHRSASRSHSRLEAPSHHHHLHHHHRKDDEPEQEHDPHADGYSTGGRKKRRRRRNAKEALAPTAAPTAEQVFHVLMYNTPKETLGAVTRAGMAKSMLPWPHLFLLAFLAGVMLSMSNLSGFVVGGGFAGSFPITDPTGTVVNRVGAQAIWAKFLHGAIFPIGLVLIVLAGSELVTGNVMYLSAAMLAGRAPILPTYGRMGMAWLGNFAGSVVTAFLLAYLPSIMSSGSQWDYLASVADKKLNDGWGSVVLKGLGCNWLVCMALWCNLTAQDIISKIVAIWMPIAVFFWIGWEHVVANFFTLPLALMEGATGSSGFGEILAWNIIPATVGNFLGGSLFIFCQWLIYGERRTAGLVKVSAEQQRNLFRGVQPPKGARRAMRKAATSPQFKIELHPSDIADSANPHRATNRGLMPIERRAIATATQHYGVSEAENSQSYSSASDHSPMPSPMASPRLEPHRLPAGKLQV